MGSISQLQATQRPRALLLWCCKGESPNHLMDERIPDAAMTSLVIQGLSTRMGDNYLPFFVRTPTQLSQKQLVIQHQRIFSTQRRIFLNGWSSHSFVLWLYAENPWCLGSSCCHVFAASIYPYVNNRLVIVESNPRK